MRSIILGCLFLFTGAAAYAQAQVGVFYPVSTNGKNAAACSNHFSFNLLQGVSRNETGFTLSGLVTNIKDSASGVQIAGLVNTTGRESKGLQIAGLLNTTGHESKGIQIAGLANTTGGSAHGVQIGGIGNIAGGFHGLGATPPADKGDGIQIGGIVNKSANVNTQIAGIVNIAQKVKGVQIAGLINIADSSDYPIGLINIIHNGDMTVGVSTDQSLTTLATFRSGGTRLYGIVGAGYNLKHADRNLYAMQAGIGAHLIYTPIFKLNAEAVSVSLTDFKGAHNLQTGLTIYPTMRVYKRMEVFAGPSFNYTLYRREAADVHHHYVWSDTNSRGKEGVFIGAVAGIQWTL